MEKIEFDRFDNFRIIGETLLGLMDVPNSDVRFREVEVPLPQTVGLYLSYDFRPYGVDDLIILENGIIRYPGNMYHVIYNRLFKFLEISGYGNTPFNRTILSLLHELGHVDYFDKLYRLNMVNQYNYINDVIKGAVFFTTTQESVEEHRSEGLDTLYVFRGDEMYADAFAIKHFVAAINLLYKKGLVTEGDAND